MSHFNCSSFKLVLVAAEATMKLINLEIHEITIGFLKKQCELFITLVKLLIISSSGKKKMKTAGALKS